jgi:ABC-type transport system involved in multi-copper enzyme maturation permease subunit
MTALIMNTFSEKIRSKTFYIVAFIGMIIMLFVTTNNSSLSINGRKVIGFEQMVPVSLSIISFISCLLAIMVSIQTIPNEFERKTSHLILIRGIKPWQYMFSMTAGNILTNIFCMFLLSISLFLFCIYHGKAELLLYILLSMLLLCVNSIFLSAAVSLLSIKLPAFAAGIAGILIYVLGILHGILYTFVGTAEGITALAAKTLLFITPDFSAVQEQASAILVGNPVDLQPVVGILLLTYMVISLVLVTFRKEV